jgi:MFS family permease
MLKKLHLSYGGFAILTAAAVTAKVIALPFFGRYAQRAGTRKLLWIGGLGIVPLSALWWVSDNFAYLMVLQIVGGVAWAAYELAMFLLFFETIDARERTGVLTIYNLGNALATVGGSLAGWAFLKAMGETQQAFLMLFLLSSCCRIGALVLLARVTGVLDVVRRTIPVVMRIVSVNPAMGSIDRPILSSMPEEKSATPAAASAASAVVEPPHLPAMPAPVVVSKSLAADNMAVASIPS